MPNLWAKDSHSSVEILFSFEIKSFAHLFLACIWWPWTEIICPDGDLLHHSFLFKKKMASKTHATSWRARRPSQGLLIVHLPDVKAQRQKVIVSKWLPLLAWQDTSHVVDMKVQFCQGHAELTPGPNPGKTAKQSSLRALSHLVFLENGMALLYLHSWNFFKTLCFSFKYYRSMNFYRCAILVL